MDPFADNGVGIPTPGAQPGEGEPSVRDILGPDTPEGQSIWLIVAGLAILFLAVGGEGRGVVNRARNVGGFLLLVAAGVIVVNGTVRWYTEQGTALDRPFAAGLTLNV